MPSVEARMWVLALLVASVFASAQADAREATSAPVASPRALAVQFAQAPANRPQRRHRKPRAKPKAPAATPAAAATAPAAKPVPAPAAPPAARGKPMSVAETYAAMTAAERAAIQTDLVWTGYYNGIADGDFGERSIAAVRDYQQRSNAKPTGILNPQERVQLAALAKGQQDLVGWRIVEDTTTGVRLGLPMRLVPQTTRGKERTRWASPSGDIQIETFRVNDPDTTLASVAAK
jgi:hypothetical protein